MVKAVHGIRFEAPHSLGSGQVVHGALNARIAQGEKLDSAHQSALFPYDTAIRSKALEAQFSKLAPVATLALTPPLAVAAKLYATGAGAPVAKAAVDTVTKWGGRLFSATPWARVATVVGGAGLWAYERGLFDRFFPRQGEDVQGHALLGRPSGSTGGKEEFPMADHDGLDLEGVTAHPELRRGAALEGIKPTDGSEHFIIPGKARHEPSGQSAGGFELWAPAGGAHILWSEAQSGNISVDGISSDRTLSRRPGMAEYAGANRPKENFADEVVVTPKQLSTDFSFVRLDEKGNVKAFFSGYVDKRGVMRGAIEAPPGADTPRGRTIYQNVVKALDEAGVAVHMIEASWLIEQEGSDNFKTFEALAKMGGQSVTEAIGDEILSLNAAAQTFSGKVLRDYGVMPNKVDQRSGAVVVDFADPLLNRLYGLPNQPQGNRMKLIDFAVV